MPIPLQLQIVGLTQLRRTLRDVGGRGLEKQLGGVHKEIGEMVIRAAGGANTQVGEGRGQRIRPSAAVREVQLRVGGSHRGSRADQWGAREVWPGGEPPERPHLIGAARDIESQIRDAYMDGIDRVIRGAGLI